MSERVAIRVDASEQLGVGHLSRCLALADGLARAGASVLFVSRELAKSLQDLVRQHGHEVHSFEAVSPLSWLQDAAQTRRVLEAGKPWRWLIVDHYGFDERWEADLQDVAGAIMVIDDKADRPHRCALLLDQNAFRDAERRYQALVNSDCMQLLGPRFALLRPQFRQQRSISPLVRTQLRSVLIFFGGSDPSNLTGRALDAAVRAALPGLKITVVVGALNPHRAAIEAQCVAVGADYHCQIDNMMELMAHADLAVGAAGTASWERCCVGLPAVLITIADNQVRVAVELAARRAAINLGADSAAALERLSALLVRLSRRPQMLSQLSRRAARLVDGIGVERVCFSLLGERSLRLRAASESDAQQAWEWRNSSAVRASSFDSAPIPFEKHLAWWRAALASADRVLLVGMLLRLPIGVIRLDLRETLATISIYLDPALTGQGVGPALLRCATRWVQEHLPALNRIEALVKTDNRASRKAFLAAGYREDYACYVQTW